MKGGGWDFGLSSKWGLIFKSILALEVESLIRFPSALSGGKNWVKWLNNGIGSDKIFQAIDPTRYIFR